MTQTTEILCCVSDEQHAHFIEAVLKHEGVVLQELRTLEQLRAMPGPGELRAAVVVGRFDGTAVTEVADLIAAQLALPVVILIDPTTDDDALRAHQEQHGDKFVYARLALDGHTPPQETGMRIRQQTFGLLNIDDDPVSASAWIEAWLSSTRLDPVPADENADHPALGDEQQALSESQTDEDELEQLENERAKLAALNDELQTGLQARDRELQRLREEGQRQQFTIAELEAKLQAAPKDPPGEIAPPAAEAALQEVIGKLKDFVGSFHATYEKREAAMGEQQQKLADYIAALRAQTNTPRPPAATAKPSVLPLLFTSGALLVVSLALLVALTAGSAKVATTPTDWLAGADENAPADPASAPAAAAEEKEAAPEAAAPSDEAADDRGEPAAAAAEPDAPVAAAAALPKGPIDKAKRKEVRTAMLKAYKSKAWGEAVKQGIVLRDQYGLDWETQYRLAEAMRQDGQEAAATAGLLEFAAAYPTNAYADDALYAAATLLIKKGAKAEAKKALTQAASNPKDDFAKPALKLLKSL